MNQIFRFQDIKGGMIIEDVTGKPLSAMKVFAKSIEALMQHLFDIFNQRGIDIKKTEIRWVLTVPAVWSDAAKQFMRRSAELVCTLFKAKMKIAKVFIVLLKKKDIYKFCHSTFFGDRDFHFTLI